MGRWSPMMASLRQRADWRGTRIDVQRASSSPQLHLVRPSHLVALADEGSMSCSHATEPDGHAPAVTEAAGTMSPSASIGSCRQAISAQLSAVQGELSSQLVLPAVQPAIGRHTAPVVQPVLHKASSVPLERHPLPSSQISWVQAMPSSHIALLALWFTAHGLIVHLQSLLSLQFNAGVETIRGRAITQARPFTYFRVAVVVGLAGMAHAPPALQRSPVRARRSECVHRSIAASSVQAISRCNLRAPRASARLARTLSQRDLVGLRALSMPPVFASYRRPVCRTWRAHLKLSEREHNREPIRATHEPPKQKST